MSDEEVFWELVRTEWGLNEAADIEQAEIDLFNEVFGAEEK